MPKGKKLSGEAKSLIIYHLLELNKSPEEIYIDVFFASSSEISIEYLTRVCSTLRNSSYQDLSLF
jgi:hypothetical protein